MSHVKINELCPDYAIETLEEWEDHQLGGMGIKLTFEQAAMWVCGQYLLAPCSAQSIADEARELFRRREDRFHVDPLVAKSRIRQFETSLRAI